MKLKKIIVLEDILSVASRWYTASTPRDIAMLGWFGCPGFGGTDWMRNWR
jgi:hypothetical protein